MNKPLCLTILLSFSLYFSSEARRCTQKQSVHSLYAKPQEVTPEAIVAFAKQFLGVPYKFGGSSPQKGFDCSGFVNYVFRNFQFPVPRSSSAFNNKGRPVQLPEAQAGDIILFRGTNPKEKSIGHVGIVISDIGEPLRFIHASSGKIRCVTETPFDSRYQKRFVKIIRLTL